MELRQLLALLKETRRETLALFELAEPQLSATYAPGKWNVRYMLHHLADSEMVLYDRIRRVLAEPKQTVVWAFDQDAWAAVDYDQTPLSLSRDLYAAVRALVLRRAEQFYDSHGDRPFVHSEMGLRTLREEFDKVALHNAHHLGQIRRALADAPT